MSSAASGDRMSWTTMLHEVVAELFQGAQARIAGGQLRLRPLEGDVRLHPRQDFLELERLGDVVDAARVERQDLVGGVGRAP